MIIREYISSDTPAIAQLFYDTVHQINIRDYTQEQVDAWASKDIDLEFWRQKLSSKFTYVGTIDEVIVGFIQLEGNGHIDCFYCHCQYQGQGIGNKLYQHLELKAKLLRIDRLFVEASITAKPFFEKQGFVTVQDQEVERKKIKLRNFVMEKLLA
ncbi:MAG: GNAT family N-acetyltransferase [Cyanosarcina radialis HA8281-LM2]|jgi:putative acetyltransferase|nr:GNAT family N-acetyltransferase [Cyanosarcina radialis HA8281-LM2]